MAKKLTERERARKEERRKQNQADKKKKFIKEVIVALAVIFLSVALIFVAIWGAVTGYEAYLGSNAYLRKHISLKTDHYEIDNAMLTYFYYDSYYGFTDYYSSALTSYGLDSAEPLDEIECTLEDYETWHDYFVASAAAQVSELLALAEESLANGISLSDADSEAVKIRAERTDLSRYPGVKDGDVYRCLQLTALAMKYSQHLKDSFTPSTEDAEKEYTEYPKYYQTVDLRLISIPYDSDSAESSFTQKQATDYANEFKECTTSDEFTAQLSEFLDKCGLGLSDDEKASVQDDSFLEGQVYSEGDIVSEWQFDSARKVGDVFVYDNEADAEVTAYMITSVPERNTSPTATVRHILFRTSVYGTSSSAQAEAEKILEKFNGTDRSEDAFAELALSYSDDTSSAFSGGLYKNFESGTMIEEFDDWCFDEARVSGDVSLVRTDYGTHIIYYVSEGDPAYIASVKSDISEEEYNSIGTSIVDKINITADDEAMGKIKSAYGTAYEG